MAKEVSYLCTATAYLRNCSKNKQTTSFQGRLGHLLDNSPGVGIYLADGPNFQVVQKNA